MLLESIHTPRQNFSTTNTNTRSFTLIHPMSAKMEHCSIAICIYRIMQFPMFSWPHHRGNIIYDLMHCLQAWHQYCMHVYLPKSSVGATPDLRPMGLEIASGPSWVILKCKNLLEEMEDLVNVVTSSQCKSHWICWASAGAYEPQRS